MISPEHFLTRSVAVVSGKGNWRRLGSIALTLMIVMVPACHGRYFDPAMDSELFEVALRSALENAELSAPFFADPRPLAETLTEPDWGERIELTEVALARRSAVLQTAGVKLTTDISRRGCYGHSFSDQQIEREAAVRRSVGAAVPPACADSEFTVIGIGLPSRMQTDSGRPTAPESAMGDSGDFWSTDILATTFANRRVLTVKIVVVARRTAGRWEVVRSQTIGYVH